MRIPLSLTVLLAIGSLCSAPSLSASYWIKDTEFAPMLEDFSEHMSIQFHSQVDGKLLISTNYDVVNGVKPPGWLFRLNADGSIDPTFGAPQGGAMVLWTYGDGRILYAETPDVLTYSRVVRRSLPSGQNDPAFTPIELTAGEWKALILSDERIVLYDTIAARPGAVIRSIGRFNSNGVLDPTFQSPFPEPSGPFTPAIEAVAESPQGGALLIAGSNLNLGAGRERIARLSENGTVDPAFVPAFAEVSGYVNQVYAESDGGVLVATNAGSIVRLDATGARDLTFVTSLVGSPGGFGARQPDGKIFYRTWAGMTHQLRRMNPNGSDDATFTPIVSGMDSVFTMPLPVLGNDGMLYLASMDAARRSRGFRIARFDSTGNADLAFGPRFGRLARIEAHVRQPDGRHVLIGRFDRVNGVDLDLGIKIVRLYEGGALDETFGSNLPVGTLISRLEALPGDRLIAFGQLPVQHAPSRPSWFFSASGKVESTEAPPIQPLLSLAVDESGRIYGRKSGIGPNLARYFPDGSVDSSFVPVGLPNDVAYLVPLSGGSILVARQEGYGNFKITRMGETGGADASFAELSIPAPIAGMTALPDNSALLVTLESVGSNGYYFAVRRLRAHGSFDFTYRTRPFKSTVADPEIRLAIAGVILDLVREGVADGVANVRAILNDNISCTLDVRTDGQLVETEILPSAARSVVKFVRTQLTTPSFEPGPFILSQNPTDSVVRPLNSRFIATAIAGGLEPFAYQWYRGEAAVSGATGYALHVEPVKSSDTGDYSLRVSNAHGSVQSEPVTLTVDTAQSSVVILAQPTDQTAVVGGTATFSVSASGVPAPSYQWRCNGVNIPGANGPTLTLNDVQVGAEGSYTVRVNNVAIYGSTGYASSVVSQPAKLKVVGPPGMRPALFDAESYLLRYPAVAAQFAGLADRLDRAWTHYLEVGIGLGYTDGEFDSLAYLQEYPDLNTLFGGNAVLAALHWYEYGRAEGLRIPAGFDVQAYLARNPENAMRFANDLYGAWLYYRDVGIYDGEVYDDLFRPEEYLALYPELLAALGPDLKKALLHWLAEGRIEGRLGRIPLEFDVAGYFERNPDVAAAMGGNAILGWQHFWNYGIYEGRAYDDEFRAFEYLALNEDLQAAFLNDWRGATLHWLRYGRIEGRLGRVPPIFDVNFYLTQYPDVEAVWGTYQSTVFLHYYGFGVYEARIFDNEFRVDDYIALNPDLQAVFGTDRRGAFMHWVRWGRSEGRPARLP